IAVAAATQARGTILVFEKMFENRLFFVDKLVSMGARIIVCDPHRVVVTGPARLYGQRMASPSGLPPARSEGLRSDRPAAGACRPSFAWRRVTATPRPGRREPAAGPRPPSPRRRRRAH